MIPLGTKVLYKTYDATNDNTFTGKGTITKIRLHDNDATNPYDYKVTSSESPYYYWWLLGSYLTIDTQYYREENLKQLGI